MQFLLEAALGNQRSKLRYRRGGLKKQSSPFFKNCKRKTKMEISCNCCPPYTEQRKGGVTCNIKFFSCLYITLKNEDVN